MLLAIIQTDAVTAKLKFPPILAAIETLRPTKRVVFAGLDEGAAVPPDYVDRLRALNVPYFPSAERAVRALARLGRWNGAVSASPMPQPAKSAAFAGLAGVIPEWRAKLALASIGIPFPQGALATTPAEAVAIAAKIGYPVVIKAQSAELPHKSDAGGVIVGLRDEAALEEGWAKLKDNVGRSRPGLALDGVLIEAMGAPGVELIVGGRNDPEWGPVVVVGFGGVQAEILKDLRLLAPDANEAEILAELKTLKAAALLEGFRGSPPLDLEALRPDCARHRPLAARRTVGPRGRSQSGRHLSARRRGARARRAHHRVGLKRRPMRLSPSRRSQWKLSTPRSFPCKIGILGLAFGLSWRLREGRAMSETRKIAAILVSDVVGYSRLAGADEDRTLARLRALRSDLIDPTIAVHHGRIVKRTGDGSIVEFRSVVEAVRCATEVQHAMVERNAGVEPDKRIDFRIGIHLGDVVEEADGDLMGEGVNIAARLEGIAAPGAICLSEDAYRQVKGRLDLAAIDLGPTQLKNIAEPIRVYSLQVGVPAQAKSAEPVHPVTPGRLRRRRGVSGLPRSPPRSRHCSL